MRRTGLIILWQLLWFYCTLWSVIVVVVVSSFAPPRGVVGVRHSIPIAGTALQRSDEPSSPPVCFIDNVVLVQCGFGNDSHGQNATKAAIRACRNAIEFNSIRISKIIPGGYDAMKVNIILGVPSSYQHTLDLKEVVRVFPFGETRFKVVEGGLVAPSGRAITELGDKNDDMVMVVVAVQVGY